ncbi:MAG: DNA mismatch repair endonuclease MutL, partial [Firmicutes bacterium]|nr:DNA mismatch repair endonuclease MutL [Bacillota bacterium]
AGCPVGTAIEVKELFFNTPARRKFLKSANAETGQVSDLISRLAMAKPDVRFELRSGGKILFFSPGNGSLKDTAAVIFGADNVRSMLEVNYRGNFLSVDGLISKPVLTRASRQYQNFFINGRYIRSGLISAVLQQAYETQIPSGRFPIAILHLNLDPTQVDVNVHPTKMEVRLAREKEVQEELLEALCKPLDLSGAITGLWEIMPGRGNAQSEEDRAGAGEARPLVNPITPEPREYVPAQLLDPTEDRAKLPSPPTKNKEQLRFSLPAGK